MLPTYCPQCRSIRQPNGRFCHSCGYSYEEQRATGLGAPLAVAPETGLSVSDGFRLGVGFMVAIVIFWIVFAVLSTVLFAGLLGALLRGFAP